MSLDADYLDSIAPNFWAADSRHIRDAATKLRRLEKVAVAAIKLKAAATYVVHGGTYYHVTEDSMAELRAALATVEGTPK